MGINLIDKIVPKNAGFTGMVDAEQVIGSPIGGVIPDSAISESSVLQWVSGLSGGYNTIQNSGTALAQETTINFVGDGVTASAGSNVTIITIPGISELDGGFANSTYLIQQIADGGSA